MSEKYLLDCWPGEDTMEDVTTWGIQPLQWMDEIFDQSVFKTDCDEWLFFHYQLKSKLANLEEVIRRYDLYQMFLEHRLKELCPEDPLLTDAKNIVAAEIKKRDDEMAEWKKKKEQEEAQKPKSRADVLKEAVVWASLLDDVDKKG